jgi:hypothetical protein
MGMFIYALRPSAVIISHQHRLILDPTQLRLGILYITHDFHPLPDRDRSRIANAGQARPEPPVLVTVLLIVWDHTIRRHPERLGADQRT